MYSIQELKLHLFAMRSKGLLGFPAGGADIMMVTFDKGDGDPLAPDVIDRVNGRPNFQMLVYPGGKAPEKVSADTLGRLAQ